MYNLALAQKTDRIAYFRIFDHAENIVVGCTGFLLWGDLVSTTYTKI